MTTKEPAAAPPPPPGPGQTPTGLSRRERLALFVQRGLDKRLTPLGVWFMRRTKGSIAKPWKVDVLLLTTRGRKSGRQRTVVLQYFPDGEAMIVAAANDGGAAHPGWYFNLVAEPRAQVEVAGRRIPVRAEELPAAEAAAWWQRILVRAPDYERYTRATSRVFPIVRLVPTAAPPLESSPARPAAEGDLPSGKGSGPVVS
jgi:deazaflavin-dependent oxidoreductase (nitroreductase family)